jgi:hypothetical protein
VHAPPAQICVLVHAAPQVPQLFAFVAMFTSHPSLAIPLQSAKPASHVNPHVPALQFALALAGTGQFVAHPPQFIGSVFRSAHTVSQRVCPVVHITLHNPMSQTGAVAGHVTPQPPQLFWSLLEIGQPLIPDPHCSHPVSHPHTPAVQCAFAPQTVVHVPQWVGSDRVSDSQPFIGSASQSAKPVAHPHPVAPQTWFAPHAVPQAPQFARSASSCTSQPFAGSPSQSARPAGHTHMPSVHAREGPQSCPQAPQFMASLAASISQPFTTLRSQSSRPITHTPVHVPPLQVVPGQTSPHAPQFAGSRVTAAHAPLQHISPVPHAVQVIGASTVSAGGASTATEESPSSVVTSARSEKASVRNAASPPSTSRL